MRFGQNAAVRDFRGPLTGDKASHRDTTEAEPLAPLVFHFAKLIMSAQSLYFSVVASHPWPRRGSACRVEQARGLPRTRELGGMVGSDVTPRRVLRKDVPWQCLACGVLQPLVEGGTYVPPTGAVVLRVNGA